MLLVPLIVYIMADRDLIFKAINAERDRQDEKWGDQSGHSDDRWMTILVEEVGESAQEILDGDEIKLFIELTQVAAVTVQWMEALLTRHVPNTKE